MDKLLSFSIDIINTLIKVYCCPLVITSNMLLCFLKMF